MPVSAASKAKASFKRCASPFKAKSATARSEMVSAPSRHSKDWMASCSSGGGGNVAGKPPVLPRGPRSARKALHAPWIMPGHCGKRRAAASTAAMASGGVADGATLGTKRPTHRQPWVCTSRSARWACIASATSVSTRGASASLHCSAAWRAYPPSKSSSMISAIARRAASTIIADWRWTRSSCKTKGIPSRVAVAKKQFLKSAVLPCPRSICAASLLAAPQPFSPSLHAGATAAMRPKASAACSAETMSSGCCAHAISRSTMTALSSSGRRPGSAWGARPQMALPTARVQFRTGTGPSARSRRVTSTPSSSGSRATSLGSVTRQASSEIASTPPQSTAPDEGARTMASNTAPRPLSWPKAHTAACSSKLPLPRTLRRARASTAPACRKACAPSSLPSTRLVIV
mmetsp:Transcript_16211/g.31725  ORF Transcript_16211/g.31725 Transcript_16211/m.31725 type:complete len:404 (-) Transcript_16211:879-2090(-)